MNGNIRLVAVSAIAVAAWAPAGVAQAGTYTVEACQSAKEWRYGSFAFELDRSTQLLGVKRGCGPWGKLGRDPSGLSAVAGRGRGRVGYGAHARALFRAPAGMRIESVEWSGLLKRCDPAWSAGVAAAGGGPNRWVMSAGGNRFTAKCDARAQSSAAPRPVSLSRVRGATAIYSQVRCAARRGCAVSALRRGEVRADARTFAARVTLNDPAPPVVKVLGGELASGRWLNGRRELLFSATDGSGISVESVSSSRGSLGNKTRTCNPTQRVPCPGASGRIVADTTNASDGPQALALNVYDAARQARPVAFRALIDNNPPRQVPATVVGGEGWRRSGLFTMTWQNPPEPARAPISGVYYQLRRAGTEAWSAPKLRPGAGVARLDLSVDPGEWELRLWRLDAAGNASSTLASQPVRLRYDNEVPQLGFEAQDRQDPARVSVLAREQYSGLASGEIEVRREGEAAWRPVASQLSGGRIVARLDDAALPAGVYALRARAADRAGNVGFGERRADGFPAVITLPARARSALQAGAVTRRTVRRRARRGGRGRTIRRRVVRLAPIVRARLGRRVVVRGALTGPSGAPLAGTPLRAIEQPELGPPRSLAPIRTGSDGRFQIVVRAARNTTLWIAYPGSARVLPSQRAVAIRVPAATRIRASRRTVRNGGGVTFSGRVRTLPIPAAGKLVEIQAHFRGRWRTFQTVRTTASGGWRFRYRFGATAGRVRYRFRALLAAESGYPYTRGASRTVRVTVTG